MITVAALRFLYMVTLQKPWTVAVVIPAPKRPQTLPVILSRAEVVQFLDSVTIPTHRVIHTTCYAAGLRISEAVHLTLPAIDSQRIDSEKLEWLGVPVPVLDGVLISPGPLAASVSVSNTGALVYVPGGAQGQLRQMVWQPADGTGEAKRLVVCQRLGGGPRPGSWTSAQTLVISISTRTASACWR